MEQKKESIGKVKIDLKDVIHKAAVALKNRDVNYLRKISNLSLDNAAVIQDESSVSIAVIIYSLSKILGRIGKETEEQTTTIERIINRLEKAKILLKKQDQSYYKKVIKEILEKIDQLDERLAVFIEEVVDKAKIKKSSNIYEHGISLGRSAEITGVSQWDLMNYVGKTTIYDKEAPARISAQKRLRYAEIIFGL